MDPYYLFSNMDHQHSSSNPNPNSTTLPDHTGPDWAIHLLDDCARAIASHDTPRAHQLMWTLNELASPYGDTQQKLSAYFLRAIIACLTSSGPATLLSLNSASDLIASFDSTVKTALKFQELSPWSTFGHVASNSAILQSFLHSSSASPPRRCRHLHILDLSNTFCTQWPNLLEALATQSTDFDSPPLLTITTVLLSSFSILTSTMNDIRSCIKKFARLLGIPFEFEILHHSGDLSNLDLHELIQKYTNNVFVDELAVNMINALRCVRRRSEFLKSLRALQPRIITVVEEEADLEEERFLERLRESLRFFSAYFDSLEESFKIRISKERLALERAAGRALVDVVACGAEESMERRERARGWTERMRAAGMRAAEFSNGVGGDVRALVRRYGGGDGWSVGPTEAAPGMFLKWKEEPVVWASVWEVLWDESGTCKGGREARGGV